MQTGERYSLSQIFYIVSLIWIFLIISSKTLIDGFNSIVDEEIEGGITTYFYILLIFLFSSSFIRIKTRYNKMVRINFILLIYFLYFFLSYNLHMTFTLRDFLGSLIVLSWIFTFKLGGDIAKWSENKFNHFIKLLIIFVIIPLSLLTYIYYFKNDILGIIGNKLIGNDAIFSIAVYFPFIFAIKKQRLLKIILLISFLTISFLSYKRSIIIAVVLSFIVYIVLSIDKKVIFKYLWKWYSVLFIVCLGFLFRFLDNLIGQTILNRFNRIGTDRGSGRLDIYNKLFNELYYSNQTNILFGHGYQSTKQQIGMLAHNDFIQILFDFGLIGSLLYSLFIFAFLYMIFKKYKNKKAYRNEYASYVAAIVFLITMSMMNCFIYSPSLLMPIMFFLGMMYFKIYIVSNSSNITFR